MRSLLSAVAFLALVACDPAVPDSAAGVGFEGYSDYELERSQREAELTGSGVNPSHTAISDEVVTAGDPIATSSRPPLDQDNPNISDEQDFSAVSARESIESDRERLAAQSQAYQVIKPTALPTRSGASGPSIVEFALSTSNGVGQSVYNRSKVFAETRFDRNCAKYSSSDVAQLDFLKSGGPKRDRKGLDPDGDGFACYWDPAPFRQATHN